MIMKYLAGGALTASLVLGSCAWVQTVRIKHMKMEVQNLHSDLRNVRAAIALTDSLQRANANLNQEREYIRDDLASAKGYTDPLSDDLRAALDRLRRPAGNP